MGAWGFQVFENDHALDWVDRFAKAGNISILMDVLGEVLRPARPLRTGD